MWAEVEPGDMLMMRYLLCFPTDAPNPEDRHIRALLRDHNLHPKRRWFDERQGNRCEVLQFGQCYLGRAVNAIVALQQRGMVAESVAYSLDTDADLTRLVADVDHAAASDLVWTVAGLVLENDGIQPAPDNPDNSIIAPLVLADAVRRAVAEQTNAPSLTE
jgi:hypothetical protein